MGNKELFQKVKELNLPIGEYALFGSAPMGVRGLRECHDIDIIVTEKLWNDYKNKSEWKLMEIREDNNYFEGLRNDDIELWKDWWPGWNVDKLIQEAEIIDGLPFVKLEEVIKWKRFRAREKDLKDVEIIEKFKSN
jgi:hypothetical protein